MIKVILAMYATISYNHKAKKFYVYILFTIKVKT